MSEDLEYTEQEQADEAKAEFKEQNECKPSSPEHLNLDENAMQANANIAEGQKIKLVPDNNEEQDKVVKVGDAAVKSLPTMGS